MIGGVAERKLRKQVAEGLDLTEFKSKLSDEDAARFNEISAK